MQTWIYITLNTSAKNPSPIFSQLKSSRRVSAETACLSAWQDCEPGVRPCTSKGDDSRSSSWFVKSPTAIVRDRRKFDGLIDGFISLCLLMRTILYSLSTFCLFAVTLFALHNHKSDISKNPGNSNSNTTCIREKMSLLHILEDSADHG